MLNINLAIETAKSKLKKQLKKQKEVSLEQQKMVYPYYTINGKWSWEDQWSNGFFPGQLWLMSKLDIDTDFWIKEAVQSTWNLKKYKEQGDFQDIGYILVHSFVLGHTITSDAKLRQVALEGANNLFESLMPGNYLKCKWLKDGDYYVGIDGFMNNMLWLWAYLETGDNRFKTAANNCIDKTIDSLIFQDGKSCEYVKLDEKTNQKVEIFNKLAAQSDSVWARGHTWAIYGIVKAYLTFKDERYLKIINKLSDYLVENSRIIPKWDLSANEDDLFDTSAASVAASAFLYLSNNITIPYLKEKYYYTGERILSTLLSDKHLNNNNKHEGVLLNAASPKLIKAPGESHVCGDYFLLEAILHYMGGKYGNN